MNNKTRMPRPFGLTTLMQEYHISKDPQLIDKIKGLVIQTWIMNNGMVFGKHLSVTELSLIIGCTAGEIHDKLATQMMGSKLWDKNTNNEIINQLLGMAVAWNIEDRIAIENQVGLLKQAQGGTYRAFISSEVNKALGLKISASNSLQSLIKSLTSGGTINIFNQQNNNTQINSSHVTVEQAIDLVQNQLNESNHEPRGYIEGAYAMGELPEVVATKQVGISTAKEGLSIKKRDIIGAIDDYKGAIAEADNVHHETRREIAELIDTYDDDPEADLY